MQCLRNISHKITRQCQIYLYNPTTIICHTCGQEWCPKTKKNLYEINVEKYKKVKHENKHKSKHVKAYFAKTDHT